MTDRIGDWIQTFTGRQFWPLEPRAEEVHIEDIAHALSNQCRFSGHCKKLYSVAQHSVLVSRLVPLEDALWGLLHDASEAYLVDLPRPIKRASAIGEHYRIAEGKVMAVICERFGLSLEMPRSVHEADDVVLMTEARDLMAKPPVAWKESAVKPLSETIDPWSPEEAEQRFLARFRMLQEFGENK